MNRTCGHPMSPVKFLTLIGLVTATGLVMGTLSAGGADGSDGCDLFTGSITESEQFTPAEAMRTQPRDGVLDPNSEGGVGVLLSLDSMPIRWMNQDASALFFFDEPVAGIKLFDLYARGGLLLTREPIRDGVVFADTLKSEIGDRAVEITVGASIGAMTWADPNLRGTRTHNIYWADGVNNYSLIGVRAPEEMVNLARGLACGGMETINQATADL